ncbi:translation initiation factor [Niabella ginsengisoli]|uniref:Translation initiation factor n=1 Tax=Niabella ginsengisoli TaxID=522298 RepID=A0ABS9SR09_9BACT|nr:translation initiation factor [Niabella ginsengisoli]MCH5600666.1 translation initiation factor [Niabella ginsengisoli]
MSKNKSSSPFVCSTNPDFKPDDGASESVTLTPAEQRLRLQLETKQRGGKTATVILGFIGIDKDLEDLSKKLKSFCGTGGSAKDGEIIIQGDHRDKLLQWFLKNGYKNVKKVAVKK